ncbi:serine/threonine-protein kinase [Lentzea albidocapillata]|uniref:non-specific serine/threonine protein kinase n=1 Tax=Lentzea albidocapillata TaxID=40571 RepID=A0A1W2FMF2_9PSEU|nr:serine/threonine-protein kinase [Lentzea albidocapillata]SMD23167.1 serine/threonine protein kinase [Lentzea albidocapillata]
MTLSSVVAALPQYAVGDQIGEGGMGVVYGGVHRQLGRPVAIKRLPHAVAEDPRMSERFEHEARLLARLDHPHIVPVYDYVRQQGEHLLVMERLDGGTVWSRFSGDGLTAQQSCGIVLAALAGLHAAHEAGVLHLDVKPKNLLFTSNGVVKVADFGISQVVSEGATLVTHGGAVLGTPAYIAPEQAMGNALSPAADVYATGTMLYELLCGDLPFERGGGPIAMIQKRVFQEPRPLPKVPEPLAGVVMRSIAREPDARYRNAETFAIDLAGAAGHLFGPDWLVRLGIPVHLAPQVSSSSTRPSLRPVPERETVTLTGQRIRATLVDPIPAARLSGSSTLVPASQVIKPPSTPWALWLVAALALIAMAVVPFVATGNPPATTIEMDLAGPVKVDGTHLVVTAAGIPLADVPQRGTEGFVLPGAARWIIGGVVTAQVDEQPPFLLESSQTPWLSLMGTGSALLLLFTFAYLESNLRALRRRQTGMAAVIASVPLGLGLGLAVWLLVSVLLKHEPTMSVALTCGVLGAAAALSASLASRRA